MPDKAGFVDFNPKNQTPAEVRYASAMLSLVKNKLVFGSIITMKELDIAPSAENALKVWVKRYPRLTAKDGMVADPEDILIGSESFSLNKHSHVAVGTEEIDGLKTWSEFVQNKTVMAAADALAQKIDMTIAKELLKYPVWIGDSGESLKNAQIFVDANQYFNEQSISRMDVNAVITSEDEAELQKYYLQSNIQGLNREMITRPGFLGKVTGVNIYSSENLPQLTTGTRTTATISGANQNTNYRDIMNNEYASQTLNVKGMGNAKTIKMGEVFTIANVYPVQPATKYKLNRLQQFVVLKDVVSDASGNAQLVISPSIVVAGTNDSKNDAKSNTTYATCDSAPADGAALTFKGEPSSNYRIRGMFKKDSIRLGTHMMKMPDTGRASFSRDPNSGVSIRFWRGSNIETSQHLSRWDIFYDVKVMENSLGVRINGIKP